MTRTTLDKTHFTNFNPITVRGDNRERKTPAKSNIVFYGDWNILRLSPQK
jgi:hypothetical protein